ncbi:hypothetical protein C3B47_11285 [Flavobacterium columnare]|uniref:hypothetical protein n=2 Tax=Flavobacterium columnare TaxID=996 RepID=UPI0009819322|nr:hypothetical protein [Flavobacterium columnare]MBF6653462.1 hypothetical protein [Flavobacterium columnare]MBF6654481.1 hypothetical protein [Flavobacterium columnare]MBF6658084.1 hypothetical protein [Flavobacterium columnare]OOB84083.1 hypothetical protein BZL53_03140 [Flavobacterium columnare]PTD15484.1 hypothetical protein C6N29_14160 [Flavobacterium columnare]
MKDFNYWDKLHKNEELEEFSNNNVGLLWLKTKSIIRKELIAEFLKINNITLQETALAKQFAELFGILSSDVLNSNNLLDDFIKSENAKQVGALNTDELVSELYKLKNFDWGGDYQNSLDKYLIKRYVKIQNPSYENLLSKFETEINAAVQGYVLNSWYNHWSSILIEHIFKSHTEVLPTVGQIKSVDFFINHIPFDLKVTYLPAEYIKTKRKEKGLPVELTFLKKKAREAKIIFDKTAKSADIFYEIVEKMKDRNDTFCLNALKTLKDEKLEILKEVQNNPKVLATWLYENQGEMRFGSENRLFLVLVDTDDFTNSWKLKRNIDLLKPTILTYLDNFKTKKIEDLKIEFEFKGKSKTFTALTDIIFVVK